MTIYYFAIASQDFLLHEEPLEEVLRERINHYKNIEKVIDFWLIVNPEFINATEMASIKKQLTKPSAAILSHNKTFIEWLKLRFGFVITGEFESPSNEIPSPLKSSG
uniref:Ycf54 n=1 Tax=Nemalion vermiculare TaxID=935621 RepID=UPI00257F53C4|nr:Ycf54 [Nemalion vermiculare]WGV34442.1 Ycf54 [Nemalion vermiculare]